LSSSISQNGISPLSFPPCASCLRPQRSRRATLDFVAATTQCHQNANGICFTTGKSSSRPLRCELGHTILLEAHLTSVQGGVHAEQEPQLLGTTENELGIRKWIEEQGHELVTTSDKEGEGSEFDKHLVDAEVIITTPYVGATPRLRLSAPQSCTRIVPETR
jgi:hypothetical protein